MKNFNIIVICFILNILSNTTFSQNLIQNGKFENGTRLINECFSLPNPDAFNGINYWEMAQRYPVCNFSTNGSTVNQCRTPDWIKADLCRNNNGFQANTILPPSTPNTEMCIVTHNFTFKNNFTFKIGGYPKTILITGSLILLGIQYGQ